MGEPNSTFHHQFLLVTRLKYDSVPPNKIHDDMHQQKKYQIETSASGEFKPWDLTMPLGLEFVDIYINTTTDDLSYEFVKTLTPKEYILSDLREAKLIQNILEKQYNRSASEPDSDFSDLSDDTKAEIERRKKESTLAMDPEMLKANISTLREEINCFEEHQNKNNNPLQVVESNDDKEKGHIRSKSHLLRMESTAKWTEEDFQAKKKEMKQQLAYLYELQRSKNTSAK